MSGFPITARSSAFVCSTENSVNRYPISRRHQFSDAYKFVTLRRHKLSAMSDQDLSWLWRGKGLWWFRFVTNWGPIHVRASVRLILLDQFQPISGFVLFFWSFPKCLLHSILGYFIFGPSNLTNLVHIALCLDIWFWGLSTGPFLGLGPYCFFRSAHLAFHRALYTVLVAADCQHIIRQQNKTFPTSI
jgi:hypothetical protein